MTGPYDLRRGAPCTSGAAALLSGLLMLAIVLLLAAVTPALY